jgi:hypothetical protein
LRHRQDVRHLVQVHEPTAHPSDLRAAPAVRASAWPSTARSRRPTESPRRIPAPPSGPFTGQMARPPVVTVGHDRGSAARVQRPPGRRRAAD